MWFRPAAAGAGLAVCAFHARLLAGQFLDGDLTDPARVARWVIAAGVAAGVIVLARRGELLVGRKAIVAWTLAALLHGPALVHPPAFSNVTSLPAVAISLLQTTLAGAALGLLVFVVVARRTSPLSIVSALAVGPVCHVAAASGFALAVSGRPPPAA